MMRNTLYVLSLTASATLAKPSPANDACSLIRHNNNYDDLKFVQAAPLVNPFRQYNGLKYDNFAGVDTTLAGLDLNLLEPPSKPNVLVTGFEQNLLKTGSISNGLASITTRFTDAPRPFFNFHDFNMACFANDAVSTLNVPVACDVTMRSYLNGAQKGQQTIHYDPHLKIDPHLSRVPPTKADLMRFHMDDPSFCDIDTVTLTIDGGSINLAETLGSLRNLDLLKGHKRDEEGSLPGVESLPLVGQIGSALEGLGLSKRMHKRKLALPKLLVASAIDNVNVTLHC